MATHPLFRLLLWLLLALLAITALPLLFFSATPAMFFVAVMLTAVTVWGAVALRRRRPDAT